MFTILASFCWIREEINSNELVEVVGEAVDGSFWVPLLLENNVLDVSPK
jgi:hypothetical protein